MKSVIGTLLLAGLWMLLFGNFDLYTFALGLVVGAVAIAFSRPLAKRKGEAPVPDPPWRTPVGLLRRVWSFLRLAWLYSLEMIKCNFVMVRDVLKPHPNLTSAIFELEVPGLGPVGATLLGNLITLTPGSLVLDFDVATETFYIHTIYAQDVETMKRDYRQFARQISRVMGRQPAQVIMEGNG